MMFRPYDPLLLHMRPRSEMTRHWDYAIAKDETTGGLPRQRLRQVLEYIDAHLDSALPTSELAARAGLSVSHFCRSFARSVGMTPHDYVLKRRVLRAQQSPHGQRVEHGGDCDEHGLQRSESFQSKVPRTLRAAAQGVSRSASITMSAVSASGQGLAAAIAVRPHNKHMRFKIRYLGV